MQVNTRNRAELKSYFVKNAIPTESNFSELIEGMLNQADDGLVKLPDNPLSIKAVGDADSEKSALNIYHSFDDPGPAWTLSLNPRSDPGNPASARPGLSISDGQGSSRLFIDRSSGNVGIGTTEPGDYKLKVDGSLCVGGFTSDDGDEWPKFIWRRDLANDWDEGLIKHSSGRGVFGKAGFGIHLNAKREFGFWSSGWKALFAVKGDTGRAYFRGNVGVGTTDPQAKLEVVGAAAINNGAGYAVKNNYMASGSLTIGSIDTDYGGGSGWIANTAGLLLEAKTNTELAVHDSGTRLASLMYYEGDNANRITVGRNMGWGAIGSIVLNGDVKVSGGAIRPTAGNSEQAGIMFPKDPGGGGGDAAWIRYYPRSGEATTFEMGTSNDANDHIALMASGGVGIGTNAPASKLDVAGPIFERLDVIRCEGRGDWTTHNHPIMQYFYKKLHDKPVGTMVRAIQDHPSWRGHYWQGWVDADRKVRVIHNYHNTGAVI